MNILKKGIAAACGIAIAAMVLAIFPAGRQVLAQDASYMANVYTDNGGNRLNVKSGGSIMVYSGGTLDVSAGTLTLSPGQMTNACFSGTLSSGHGGTGADLSAATIGAVPYLSATGVMSALARGTQNYLLQSNGAGAPSWVTDIVIKSLSASGAISGQSVSATYGVVASTAAISGRATAGQLTISSVDTAIPESGSAFLCINGGVVYSTTTACH
jgi:hypothetical protein